MNSAVGASGMALFFCLSGFLITYFLTADSRVRPFLLKRIARIVPLAWGAMIILIIANDVDLTTALANLLFFSNLPPAKLMHGGEHLWSLCVEMQFYLAAALAVGVLGQRALFLIPPACLAITILRIVDNQTISIVTWHRVDEIFAGGIVALVWVHGWGRQILERTPAWVPVACLVALPIVSLPAFGPLGYVRPYVAMLAVGLSLYSFPQSLRTIWTGRSASYVAEISYAVYVIHGMLTVTALGGEGTTKIEKYALRLPLLAATLAFAHLSTRYYERFFTKAAARLAHFPVGTTPAATDEPRNSNDKLVAPGS